MSRPKHTTFYIIRHGQTDWNLAGKIQGHTDNPLNKTGEKQAKDLAKMLKDIAFDHAYSSDLSRAKRTAEIILAKQNVTVTPTERLRERNYGDHEGKVMKRTKLFNEVTKDMSHEEKLHVKLTPTSESDHEFSTRLFEFLRELSATHPEKTVLIGAHNGVISSILFTLGYFTYESLEKFRISNGGYLILRTDGEKFFIDDVIGIEKRT